MSKFLCGNMISRIVAVLGLTFGIILMLILMSCTCGDKFGDFYFGIEYINENLVIEVGQTSNIQVKILIDDYNPDENKDFFQSDIGGRIQKVVWSNCQAATAFDVPPLDDTKYNLTEGGING